MTDAPLPPASDAAPRTALWKELWSLVVLLVTLVGVLVLVLVTLAVAFSLAVRAEDDGVDRAAEAFAAAARTLPGVRSALAEPGLGDLGTSPHDLYADVELGDACTSRAVAATAERLRRQTLAAEDFDRHPTIRCRGREVTVSRDAAVTRQRLALFDALLADPRLQRAGVTASQEGDDPTPDVDQAHLVLTIGATPDALVGTTRRWARPVEGGPGPIELVVVTGEPDLDGRVDLAFLPERTSRAVRLRTDATTRDAVLRAAAALATEPAVTGFALDAVAATAEVRGASRVAAARALHGLPETWTTTLR